MVALLALGVFSSAPQLQAASSRSTYIPYDSTWVQPPASTWMALDTAHQQIFTAWTELDRVDVLSTVDYHLIHSIAVPSPSTLDISPDGTTLAVGTNGSHIYFFSTATFAKTNDVVFPGAALGITAFLYTANGNAMILTSAVTAYWNSATNTFLTAPSAGGGTTATYVTGPIARSGDYSRIILSDGNLAYDGVTQVADGNTGQILWTNTAIGGAEFVAVNKDGSRYAISPDGITLIILNSSFQEIYQDQNGGQGMVFSADGNTLYRDISIDSGYYTQALDMTTFAMRNVHNYLTDLPSGTTPLNTVTFWQASDSTGMVYGVIPSYPYLSAPVLPYGMTWMALDTTASGAQPVPTIGDPIKIVHVLDNIGSPQGGDSIRLLCTGLDIYGPTPSVTIGGAAAAFVSVTGNFGANLGGYSQTPNNLPNQHILTVKTPAGTPGLADVVLSYYGTTFTAAKGFQYANSRTIFPFATSPNYLLYDSLRNRLYAAHTNQVEVIDVANQKVLTPLVPASGKLANSNFSALSLSPDGNRLYIADSGAGLIHLLDLTNPGSGSSINPSNYLVPSNQSFLFSPLSPTSVFELLNGMLLGTVGGGQGTGDPWVFLIDPKAFTGNWATDAFGNPIPGYVLNSTNKGENVLTSSAIEGSLGLWNASSASYLLSNSPLGGGEYAANEDGTVIAVEGTGLTTPYTAIIDFNLFLIGLIEQHFDLPVNATFPAFSLHPSGALLNSASEGPVSGSIEIDDLHQYQMAVNIVLPEPLGGYADAYLPFTDQLLATDPTGRTFFAVTQSGITMMALNTIPLSIGNLQPGFVQPQAAQTITMRGSGFQTGATVSIGGTQASATFVDENTLTVAVPALASGWQDVTVTLPSGAAYTASSLLPVVGSSQPTPVVTGFSPSAVTVQTDLPGRDTTASVTVLGSGFADYDSVEINGQAVSSDFVDSGHMQATIPAELTGQTGSIPFAVISPYTGPSNTLALPMVNPVPVLEGNGPITVIPGNGLNLNLYGIMFVPGSTIQWNGQNLSTDYSGGETGSGLQEVFGSVPGSLTAQSGTATVTVFNPPPGGGVSNPISVDISPAHPVLMLSLWDSANNIDNYYTIPSSIDLGSALLNNSINDGLALYNYGTASDTVSSIAVTSGPFSLQNNSCTVIQGLNVGGSGPGHCGVSLMFTPVSTGAFSATLTITDSTSGSPYIITLTGTGIQIPVPAVTLNSVNSIDQSVSASFKGSTLVGGSTIAGTAWIEYGTDPTLSTFTQSPSWTLTGDGPLSGSLSGLMPGTQYAARLAVQTAGGTGKSAIQLFATLPVFPEGAWTGTSTATVIAGFTATYGLGFSVGNNGYNGTINFSCTGAPTGATCSVTPSQTAVSAIVVTVTTTANTTAQVKPAFGILNLAFGFLFGTGILAFRKKLRHGGLLLCLAALALSVASCGGGSSNAGSGGGTGGGGGGAMGTPPGTYILTLNATAGNAQSTVLLTLNVQ
jgi:hypothetical protein